jgi:hypothetical protein
VLIAEGCDSSIVDCDYDPTNIYVYRAQRFWSISNGSCVDMYDECDSHWWTDDCELTECPP